jgi:hypothetical protein
LHLALITNRFETIVRAMMNTLLRTSRSAILNTGAQLLVLRIGAAGFLLRRAALMVPSLR